MAEHPNLTTIFREHDVNFANAFSSGCFHILYHFVSFSKILLVSVERKI